MSDLYFRLGEMKGFTAELADKREGYANPIRELLQNSLDASREAGQEKCKVDIYIETIDKSEIPHIEDYKRVLQRAIKTHKSQNSFNANNQRVVDGIQNTLKKTKINVLMFADNGTGMNPQKMDAILTGMSIHDDDEQSGGSFGVGHLSSYSLSSLRYVLYATKYEKGGKSASLFTGSPILAGHKDGASQRGSRGRIVRNVPKNQSNPDFNYPTRFPGFIAPKMKGIDRGTMVSILGLTEEWGDDAECAIVSNFFHAIRQDALSVKIHQDGQSKSIGQADVEALIASLKERKNKRQGDVLSGKAVHQAWEAEKEEPTKIELSDGQLVYVYIKTAGDSTPTVTLIRNGMLIARHDTMLSDDMNNLRKNENVEPFTAVIDVDQKRSRGLFDLVKGAEGPYHNELQRSRLRKDEEKKLKKLFKELSGKILKQLPEVKRDSIDLPLFSIPSESARAAGGSKSSGQTRDAKPRKTKKPPKPKPDTDSSDPHPPRPKPKVVSRSLAAKTAVRYTDEGDKWEVELRVIPKAQNARDEVYLSVCVAEDNDNLDAQAYTYLDFMAVEINGQDVAPEVKNQVKLGKLKESVQYDIVAQVQKPPNMGGMKVALLPILGLKRTQTAPTE